MKESLYIKWEYDETLLFEIGAKAASLGELKKIGIKIPQGFVVTKGAFLDFMADNSLYDRIEDLLGEIPSDIAAVKDRVQRIGELFVGAKIPDRIVDEITEASNSLASLFKGGIRFAVRSSSKIEDLSRASFAGLYDTFLNVTPGDELPESVKRCWQSTFGLRALTYFKRLRMPTKPLQDMAMAVIVQQQITPRFAGVMFTVNPLTGDASKILIEYSTIGERPVVSGESTPRSIWIDKVTRQIDRDRQDLLDKGDIEGLASIGRRIEEHFGCYQDIEWVIDGASGEIIILQARPETVWNKRHKTFHKPGETIFSFVPEVRIEW